MSTDVTAASNNLKDFKLAVEYKYLVIMSSDSSPHSDF